MSALPSFGDYELLGEIARGGMGVVYKARQLSLNRTVAVKMITAGQFASKEFVHRFRVEASAAAVLQHPNIVAVHEVGVHDGHHFFSMDYVAGKNLAEIVRDGPLPANRAARYVQKIAEAIHYAHESGILHRDLKPSNVIIDANDQPRITDFGLAKQLNTDSAATLTGEVLGTPGYMPPEQASGNRGAVKAWSDVYSIGAILYHLLTGRAPFAAGSLQVTLEQMLHQDPVSLRLLNPAVPRDLNTICLKCLEKEPEKRYASAQLLADELRRFLNHEPILAHPIGPAGKAWRWCRRKPALATALVLVVLVAIASPIAAFRINDERKAAITNRELAEARLYAADMNLAHQAVREGGLGAGKAILERHRQDTNLMGFEWRYLWARCRGDFDFSLSGHTSVLVQVLFSADGKLLASRDDRDILKVWDLTGRSVRFSLTNIVGIGGFTANDTELIVGRKDPKTISVAICDVSKGQITRSFDGTGRPISLLEEGRTVVTTTTNFLVRFIDFHSGKETLRLSGAGGVYTSGWGEKVKVSISADGRYLSSWEGHALGYHDRVRLFLWDLASRTVVSTHEMQGTNASRFGRTRTFRDGLAVVWGGYDGFLRCWRRSNSVEVLSAVPAHKADFADIVLSADERWFATAGSDQTIKLWDTATLRELMLLQGHDDRVTCLAASPDGQWLASGSVDRTVKLWNIGRRESPTSIAGVSGSVPFHFNPSGTLLALTMHKNSTVRIVEANSLRDVGAITNVDVAVGFADGGRQLVTINIPKGESSALPLRAVTFTSSSNDEPKQTSLAIWNVHTRKLQREIQVSSPAYISGVALSPDNSLVAIKTPESSVHLYGLNSGNHLKTLRGTGDWVNRLFFSPDGQTLVGSESLYMVSFWDVDRAALVRSLDTHSTVGGGLDFSPDGKILVTSGRGQIRLWDPATGKRRGELSGHREGIYALSFSPDGKTLASGSTDGTIKLWNLSVLQEVCTIPFNEVPVADQDSRVVELKFAPDGNSLWALNWTGELKVWRAASWAQIQASENENPR
jgi:WD40 repeat protein/predicted Ser/Thr protein kinase